MLVAGLLLAVGAFAAPSPAPAPGLAIPLTNRRAPLVFEAGHVDPTRLQSQLITAANKVHAGLLAAEANLGIPIPPRTTSASSIQKRWLGAEVLTDLASEELWSGEIYIGVPGQPFTIDFDTGSSDLWVPRAPSSIRNNTYSPEKSYTSTVVNSSLSAFNILYGDGSYANGSIFADTVTVADYVSFQQHFAAVSTEFQFSNSVNNTDGILGMAYQNLSALNAKPFFQNLYAEHHIWENRFSFQLSPTGAELFLGGTNWFKYSGEIEYTPVTKPYLWWSVIGNVYLGGEAVKSGTPGIVDTGTTLIIAPVADAVTFHAKIPGARLSVPNPGYYEFPCNTTSLIDLAFSFDGHDTRWAVPSNFLSFGPAAPAGQPDSDFCVSAVAAQDTGVGWIWGDVFIRTVYSVFDLENNQVGFAPLAQ